MKVIKQILLCIVLFLFSTACFADTGTYRVLDYDVKLTPRSDGTVEIKYHQRWLVTGGSIPWVTIGTPNSNFRISAEKTGANARAVSNGSYGSWSGIRIDLDKNYRPGEQFEIDCTIIQNQLFYSKGDYYQLVFWPGWYDRSDIGRLRIEVFLFAKPETVKSDPRPDSISGQTLAWERKNLGQGEKFKIAVSIPKATMGANIKTAEMDVLPSGLSFFITLFPILFFSVIAYLIYHSIRYGLNDNGYGGGPSIWVGGGRGSLGGRSGGGGIRSGGGGGFGGRAVSCVCACACVGCACACACAGGGAAGCERKLGPSCAACRVCEKKGECKLFKEVLSA